jgi:hypothetical protein
MISQYSGGFRVFVEMSIALCFLGESRVIIWKFEEPLNLRTLIGQTLAFETVLFMEERFLLM